MRKLIHLIIAVTFVTAVSCSTTRDVDYRERNERFDDDGVVIKRSKRVNDEGDVIKRKKRVDDDGVVIKREKRDRNNDGDDRESTLKIRKDRDRNANDEPVLIID